MREIAKGRLAYNDHFPRKLRRHFPNLKRVKESELGPAYFFLGHNDGIRSLHICSYDASDEKNRQWMIDILESKGYAKQEGFPIKDYEWFEKEERLYWAEPIDTNDLVRALALADRDHWDSFGEAEQYEHRVDRRQRPKTNSDVLEIIRRSAAKSAAAINKSMERNQMSLWSKRALGPGLSGDSDLGEVYILLPG